MKDRITNAAVFGLATAIMAITVSACLGFDLTQTGPATQSSIEVPPVAAKGQGAALHP